MCGVCVRRTLCPLCCCVFSFVVHEEASTESGETSTRFFIAKNCSQYESVGCVLLRFFAVCLCPYEMKYYRIIP